MVLSKGNILKVEKEFSGFTFDDRFNYGVGFRKFLVGELLTIISIDAHGIKTTCGEVNRTLNFQLDSFIMNSLSDYSWKLRDGKLNKLV